MDKFNAPMPKGQIVPIYNAKAFQEIDSFRIE
jgi:hypothetical protein